MWTQESRAISQGELRDVAVNFDTCRVLQRHRTCGFPATARRLNLIKLIPSYGIHGLTENAKPVNVEPEKNKWLEEKDQMTHNDEKHSTRKCINMVKGESANI